MAMTIRDLCEVTWNITEFDITAREPETLFYIHEFIIGENLSIGPRTRWDIQEGKATAKECKLNEHGKPRRGGSEMGWGVDTKQVPPELLDATVTSLKLSSRGRRDGVTAYVDVELNALTAACLANRMKTEDGAKMMYCDRNICASNEYNGIQCDECKVTKSQRGVSE